MPPRRTGTRGFKRTSVLLQDRIRNASQSRGFGETRLLTRWAEIVGEDIAKIARPVDISYSKQGFGATLTVLTTGPNAPLVEMQKTALRERINGVYGYNAIARVRITQTAPTGFAQGQAQFDILTAPKTPTPPDPQKVEQARQMVGPVGNDDLRKALEALGQNIISKSGN